jgi:hypothetical protein
VNYSIIKVWEVYAMDSGATYYSKNIGYYLTKEDADKAASKYYEVQPKEAIKIGTDIFLLANGIGYNMPLKLSALKTE